MKGDAKYTTKYKGHTVREMQVFRMIKKIVEVGSIRKASEHLHITPSALNRRIRQFEFEFGTDIFERLPRGVRLNAAGDVLMQHILLQVADFERVKMDIADLSDLRRGHVSIACSQALMNIFLPPQIAMFRKSYPGVTFSVMKRDRAEAERDLISLESELAFVFEPLYLADFELLTAVPQRLCAILSRDHPLADLPKLRLSDCLNYPHVMPSGDLGVRHLLEIAASRLSLRINPVIEADSFEFMRYYIRHEHAVSFQIEIGIRQRGDSKSVLREIDEDDVPPGSLFVGKLRDRELSLPAQRFADQIVKALSDAAVG